MARANVIWVAAQGDRVVRMFTVKHEAVGWMRDARLVLEARGRSFPYQLYRCGHEGGHGRTSLGAPWSRREKVSIEG